MAVDALQQDHALELGEVGGTDLLYLGGKVVIGRCGDGGENLFAGDGIGFADLLLQGQVELPLVDQHFLQGGNVPLLFDRLGRHELVHQVFEAAFTQGGDLGAEVLRIKNCVALLVDDFALVVGDVVVLQQLLAHVEVAGFDFALGAFDAAGDDAGFDGFTVGHFEAVHDGFDAVAGEDAHERVIQAEVEARGAGVALAAGAATELVVNAAGLMALGGDDAQATEGLDVLMVFGPLGANFIDAGLACSGVKRLLRLGLLQGFFHVATEHDVGAAAGHVGGDGDHLGPTGLGDDVGLAGVLFGVEDLVGELFFVEQTCDELRILNRGGAHQHGLAALVAFADVLDGGFVFFARGFVNPVELVFAAADAVGGNNHGLEAVDFLELVGLGVGSAGHTRQLAVKAEVVLECDGGHGLVFGLDLDALFGFDGLVQAVAPAPAGHQAAREFVDDTDLALLDHVVLVAVVEVVGPQRRIQVVHEGDVGGVIQAGAGRDEAQVGKDALGAFVALLGQEDLMAFFVEGEVAGFGDAFAGAGVCLAFLLDQRGHRFVDGDVEVGVVFGLATDDEGGAGFVDEDGVDLVNDGEVEPALHAVGYFVDHVVSQVVEAVFVVGAVGDVGTVGGLLVFTRGLGQVDAYCEAQEVVEAAHPLRISAGEVVVDGDDVDALAGEGVEVHGQGGGEGFALAGAHL